MDMSQLTRIFCQIDDFCKEFEQYYQSKLLPGSTYSVTPRGPDCCLVDSEIMTLLILFQSSGFRTFKNFYHFIAQHYKNAFPKLPSYNRFLELISKVTLALLVFIQINSGKKTGIYYIDSTCLPTCHIKRSKQHKTFDEIAQYGKTSVGWFFGLKLHLVINERGELIAFKITSGNKNDAKSGEYLLAKLEGLAFGDKGYLGKKLFAQLFEKGLKLITRGRKNMIQNQLTNFEKQLLNQRGLIETVINHLKHHYQVWHTRHRSVANALTHLLSALAAYVIEPLKLSAIKLLSTESSLLQITKPM